MDVPEHIRGTSQIPIGRSRTLADFQRWVMGTMQSLVPAAGAFFCLERNGVVAFASSLRVVDDTVASIAFRESVSLAHAFGLVANGARRAISTIEFDLADASKNSPYFRDNSTLDTFVRAMVMPLCEGGATVGVCGVERRGDEPPFTPCEIQRAENVAPLIHAATRAQLRLDELLREVTALRSLASVEGTLLVIDRDTRRVVWTASKEDGVDWPALVEPVAGEIMALADAQRRTSAHGEPVVSTSRICGRTIMGISDIDEKSIFGANRCVLIHLQAMNGLGERRETLSAREHEVGRLLVAGYNRVNIAAIVGLSENTVRTYIRRLYAKLGVSNRVDMVRQFVESSRNGNLPISNASIHRDIRVNDE
ncbi:helix-turn-helix transcriptional regulator [Pendulispora rubella]|uniref:Helix-turn-helix transcriptional regulator n=1 Tax=Pendulispora rubella TaxID=2741070 RepID=A0ABZ2LF28_9BACT